MLEYAGGGWTAVYDDQLYLQDGYEIEVLAATDPLRWRR